MNLSRRHLILNLSYISSNTTSLSFRLGIFSRSAIFYPTCLLLLNFQLGISLRSAIFYPTSLLLCNFQLGIFSRSAIFYPTCLLLLASGWGFSLVLPFSTQPAPISTKTRGAPRILSLISGRQMHRINACIFLVSITKKAATISDSLLPYNRLMHAQPLIYTYL